MSGLIWVQTVCKDYQQTTLVVINSAEITDIVRWLLTLSVSFSDGDGFK